ncbi:MAG: ribonuclease HII [Candidatus Paceibacterota bacterium]
MPKQKLKTKSSKLKAKYVIGIDEVGRGPLAGPITVAAVAATANSKSQIPKSKILKGIKDSKKLTSKQREVWNKILRKNFECRYVSVNNKTIDKIGIQKAIKLAVSRVLVKTIKSCKPKIKSCVVFFDGGLYLPKSLNSKFYILNSRTIIKGDEKIPVISAASIIAKVARDSKMLRFHKKYSKYGFYRHKGYGTKLHYKMIKKHGVSKIHRRSFRCH